VWSLKCDQIDDFHVEYLPSIGTYESVECKIPDPSTIDKMMKRRNASTFTDLL
jgi:hypothetical protein